MNRWDLRDWFETELGLQEFVRALRQFTTAEEYMVLLRWADRRGPCLSEVEFEWAEERTAELAELLVRWEPVGVEAAERSVAEQVELKFD